MSRAVIVAGASGGLGSAIARQFATEGNKVVLHYSRSQKDAENLARELKKGPGETMLYQADVRDFSQVKGMIDDTVKKWGRVDVLVNAAGALTQSWAGTTLLEMEEEELYRFLDIDLNGSFHCIKAVAPQMMKQREGHIIVLGGGSAFRSRSGWGGYAAGKGGIIGLCRTAAKELGPYNVKVNVVNPGPTIHPRIAYMLNKETLSADSDLRLLPQTPEELARFVVAVSELKAVSGQLLFSSVRIVR